MSTKHYEIENTTSSHVLGIYKGETADEAWAACAVDAGDPGAVRGDDIAVTEADEVRAHGAPYGDSGEVIGYAAHADAAERIAREELRPGQWATWGEHQGRRMIVWDLR